jgi:hypothetical protein
MSKPASANADCIAIEDSSFKWWTVTDCETIETWIEAGEGDNADRASWIVWTQLDHE